MWFESAVAHQAFSSSNSAHIRLERRSAIQAKPARSEGKTQQEAIRCLKEAVLAHRLSRPQVSSRRQSLIAAPRHDWLLSGRPMMGGSSSLPPGFYTARRTPPMETPVPSPTMSRGAIVSRPILGGLHHTYARAA